MKRQAIFITLTTFLISLSALALPKRLDFQKIYFNKDNTQLSGLTIKNNQLYFIGDKSKNTFLYQVEFQKNNRFNYSEHLSLDELPHFKEYLSRNNTLFNFKSALDLEGISHCDDTYFLANEQLRHILKVDSKEFFSYPIDFKKAFDDFGTPLNKVPRNAGFEGITIDCNKQLAYIAQERQPRAIIIVDLNNNKVADMFNTPSQIKTELGPDYAALHMENNFLYALVRNYWHIIKIDLKTKTVVKTMSFQDMNGFDGKDLYNTGEPYGVAEGLTMDKNTIYIGIDNNGDPLSKKAQRKFGVKGDYSSIMLFKRPEGF